MKKLLALFMVLGVASVAHGYVLGLTQTGEVDQGTSIHFTIDLTVALEGAVALDTLTAMGIGTMTDPLAATIVSITPASGWGPFSNPPPPGYAIGVSDSANGTAYDSQFIMDGYDLGDSMANFTGGLLWTMVLNVPKVNLLAPQYYVLDVFAADAMGPGGVPYEAPPTPGSVVLTPEPGTALFMLLAGALGLIRRR